MNPEMNLIPRAVRMILLATALSAVTLDNQAATVLKPIAEGFTAPISFAAMTDGSGKLLVADQIGLVRQLNADGSTAQEVFLDIRPKLSKLNQGFDERGLLALALHPDFKSNKKIYVTYSAPLRAEGAAEWDHTQHVSEFRVGDDGKVNLATERVVFQLDMPYFNHHSGCLAFGPDGFLYISIGDGGNNNDTGRGHGPKGNGQDLKALHGKVLRIDVNAATGYGIPKDNPFVEGGGRPEIFAYGFRNPWGISFDKGGTHQFFVADVGQTLYEEVNIVVKGGNYGWNTREGNIFFDPNDAKKPLAEGPAVGPDGKPFIDPVVQYKNVNGFRKDADALGISITGGYVYRGKAFPELTGKYVFADWSRNWALADGVVLVATPPADANAKWTIAPLAIDTPANGKIAAYITAVGQDTDGELYFLTNGGNGMLGKTGKVFKLIKQ